MTENQFNREPGFQQNQPSQENLTDNQTLPGNNQEGNSQNSGSNIQKEFPERTQQHDYKNPSAERIESDTEDEVDTEGEIFDQDDEVDTDGEIFDQEDENNTDPVDEQSSGFRNTNQI